MGEMREKMNLENKKEKIKQQNRKAVKKYSEKTLTFAVKYYPTDIECGQKLKEYLAESGKSANSYLKDLIKKDLDEKGYSRYD